MVLIKAVVEVGGWEILQGAESWVRGLLSLFGVSKCQPSSSERQINSKIETGFSCSKGVVYHGTY